MNWQLASTTILSIYSKSIYIISKRKIILYRGVEGNGSTSRFNAVRPDERRPARLQHSHPRVPSPATPYYLYLQRSCTLHLLGARVLSTANAVLWSSSYIVVPLECLEWALLWLWG